ncbi:MAG: hypothetical protein ABIJ12_04110 [bacterium]
MAKKKRRGRPAGTKNKAGRPAKSGGKKAGSSISIPIQSDNLAFWSEFVVFLNENKGSKLVVQTDGASYTLNAM